MRSETKRSLLYKRFDALVREAEEWLKTQNIEVCGYSAAVVKRRVAQIIARQAVDSFVAVEGTAECNRGHEQGPYAGIIFGRDSGHVWITLRERLRCIFLFAALWVVGLFSGIKAFSKKTGESFAGTLLFGVPESELNAGGSDKRFLAYCQNAPIEPLVHASRLFVATQGGVVVEETDVTYARYGRFPLFMLLADCKLMWREAFLFFVDHFACLFDYFTSSVRCPVITLLWYDAATNAAAKSLNRRSLIENVLLTNTNWLQQFLWMTDLPERRCQTIMMLYSLNSSPLLFTNEPVPMNHPGIRHLRLDKILVWEKDYPRFLRADGVQIETETAPPLVWQLPPKERLKPPRDNIRICVFDVTPMSEMAQKRQAMEGDYYSIETMTAFLNDVVTCAEGIHARLGMSCQVVVKHKRIPTGDKDRSYLGMVKSLFCDHNNVKFAPFDANLFNLISGSHLVIVIPFSSPAYLASYLNVPAIFYDPSCELLPNYPRNPNIYFSSGFSELQVLAEKLIRGSLKSNGKSD